MTLTPELIGVLDELVGKQNVSPFVEQATWALLLREFGTDEVLEAVEDVHTDPPESADPLQQSKDYELPSTA